MRRKAGINLYLRRHAGYAATFVTVMMIMGFFAPAKSFILQWLIDSQDIREAGLYLLLGCGIILGNFASNLLGNNMFSRIQTGSVSAIRNRIMERQLFRNREDQSEEHSAACLSALTNDMQIIATDYYLAGYNIIFYAVMLFISLIMYIYIDISMLLFVAIAGAASVTLPRLLDARLERSRKRYSEEIGEYTSVAKELLGGFDVIRGFGVIDNYRKIHDRQSQKTAAADYHYNKLINCSGGLSALVSNMLFFVVLLFGMFLVFQNRITLGYMVAATNLSNFVIVPCQVISANVAKFKAGRPIVNKIGRVLWEEDVRTDGEKTLEKISTVSLRDVSFHYKGSDAMVLNHVNLQWDRKNRRIAVVGESGSGKTTIAKLIYKFSNRYEGDILINGTDISEITENQLYARMGYVSQSAYIFNDTLRHNITLYDEYPDREIDAALEKSGLTEFVNSLPEGLDTLLSENGKNLSGGQIQRISLARVWLRNYDCVIADEITSNLDAATAGLIMDNLLDSDKMILMITHDTHGEFMHRFDAVYNVQANEML